MPSTPLLPSPLRAGAFVALLALAVPAVSVAQPQPPTASQPAATQPAATQPAATQPATDPARAAFEAGVAAMQAQDWPAALTAFEESMRQRRAAAVALNLGVVLHQLHRYVEARVRLQEFMNELATPAQHQQHDAEVQRLLGDIARHLARVRLTELTPATAVLSVDGRRVQLNEASEAIVDPGAHTVRAEAPGYVAFEERVDIADGATRDMTVRLAAAPTPDPSTAVNTPHPAQPTQPPAAQPIYTRWWFWTIIGVAVAAGTTTGIVIATRNTERDPPTANLAVSGLLLGGAR